MMARRDITEKHIPKPVKIKMDMLCPDVSWFQGYLFGLGYSRQEGSR
jgi:hypothetical protein